MKQRVYERQGRKCAHDGKSYPLSKMDADHIKPWSEGGKTEEDNCQVIHRKYNKLRGINGDNKDEKESQDAKLDQLMEEPCTNPHYGGLTLRQAVRKQYLNEDAGNQKSSKPKK